jgi:3-oxoacyl-[acyl-carrier protein] reductase
VLARGAKRRPVDFDGVARAVRFFLEADSDYLSGQNVEISCRWLPERG